MKMTLNQYRKIINKFYGDVFPKYELKWLGLWCCYIHIHSYSIGSIFESTRYPEFKATRFMKKKTYLLVKELLESKDKDNLIIVMEIFKNSI